MDGIRLSELARRVGAECEGDVDPLITGAAGLEEAGPGCISFVADKSRLRERGDTAPGLAL
jgi:UDP-3-O-[3-hydroxymyristoyl] glucosamine N-acyltransferase